MDNRQAYIQMRWEVRHHIGRKQSEIAALEKREEELTDLIRKENEDVQQIQCVGNQDHSE